MNAQAIGVGLLAGLVAGSAQGGFFRLEVHPASRVMADRVAVRTVFANLGDETMRNVQPAVWFNGAWHDGPRYEELPAGARREAELNVGPTPALAGRHTAAVFLRYNDRNGYPFTTIATIPVYTGEPAAESPLSATLAPLALRERGTLALTLVSHVDQAVATTVRFFVPDEIAGAATQAIAVVVPPRGAMEVAGEVRNLWALEGSVNLIFAIVDFPYRGVHESFSVPGAITVAPRRPLSARAARLLWWIPAALAATYALLQVRPRKAP